MNDNKKMKFIYHRFIFMSSSIFWYATSLVLNELPRFYRDNDDLVITEHMYNGLNQLYPDKNDEDFIDIYNDLKLKFSIPNNGVIKMKNGLIL